jgi:NAD(P)-dependent dehydrogenase (short-subunit alcohol dehydrogenase family)
MGRLGAPQEIAEAVAYLVGAEFVTGSVLVIDGGLTAA